MNAIKDQIPRGGCINCGGTVRTRKNGEWICAKCVKAGELPPVYVTCTCGWRGTLGETLFAGPDSNDPILCTVCAPERVTS